MITAFRAAGLCICVFVLTWMTGCRESTAPSTTPDQAAVAGTVQLEVVFNSQRNSLNVVVPCSAGSTVYTILERAENMGDLTFESTGQSDEMMFVKSIDGVDNLAGNGDNWVYRVNGNLGDRSAGVYEVSPGDEVQWSFGKYEEGGN